MTSPTVISSVELNRNCPPSMGTLVRIRRTLTERFSSRTHFSTNSTTSPPAAPPADCSEPPGHDPPSYVATSPQNKLRLTPFERFLNVVKRKKDVEAIFPPAGWFPSTGDIQHGVDEHTSSPDLSLDAATAASPLLSPPPPESSADEPPGDESADSAFAEGAETPPEPTFLARKIQALLAAFPQLTTSAPSTPAGTTSGPALVPSTLNSDWKFISFLSSPTVMNGSLGRDRQSVWSVLDRLRGGPAEPAQGEGAREGKGKERAVEDLRDERLVEDDGSSIMFCGPLLPTPQSEVELARSEIISVQEGESAEGVRTLRESAEDEMKPPVPPKEGRVHVTKVSEKVIWLPSKTKISLEVMWWGYRIYLPPAVLALLDNQHIEATKQAALLTTALKWILDHVPAVAVPPQMRPAFKLLKHLIPYLAYIGSFVAWSWAAIRGFDKGNGVVLTATWLLPVALIPGTWDDEETRLASLDISIGPPS